MFLNLHGFYIPLYFFSDECEDDTVQLVGLSSEYEGVVYVCKNGVWGNVDSLSWTTTDAEVVCQQLGYTSFGMLSPLATGKELVKILFYSDGALHTLVMLEFLVHQI